MEIFQQCLDLEKSASFPAMISTSFRECRLRHKIERTLYKGLHAIFEDACFTNRFIINIILGFDFRRISLWATKFDKILGCAF